ncbi:MULTISPECIES: hypothetical protein [Weissella]|uniref:hypothetical protein n=1 Tax=Weissella TaxID=46255 RepID=UPI000314C93C|nr:MULTISPECIES: hypothetical protein [Weissella]APS27003.1 hypothetical protein AUC63_00962 [Weissella cibaria]APU62400.1 hypothetical protein AUC65_00567 [Weissella cibaria]APU64552.1 hypothetical protein AUC62_00561 [Weissella cibaria]ASS52069.1 hypothetical protein CHR48_01126 [Weissella cibaria]KXU09479.1 hypothetical protein WEIDD23_00676 [Weissella sp. DD23]
MMKVMTLTAALLVAGSVLATAGVASADTSTGKASVEVSGQGGVLQIDKAPGADEKDAAGNTKANGTSINFGTVTLTQLAEKAQPMPATLAAKTFQVTDTQDSAKWQLTGAVTDFTVAGTNKKFDGTLTINSVPLSTDTSATQGAKLFDAESDGTWDPSHTTWNNKDTGASILVPQNAKVGQYEATITYNLTSGVPADAASATPAGK